MEIGVFLVLEQVLWGQKCWGTWEGSQNPGSLSDTGEFDHE